jgi:hypothetical protein
MEHVRPATATFEHLPARGSPPLPAGGRGWEINFLALRDNAKAIYEEVSNDPIA